MAAAAANGMEIAEEDESTEEERGRERGIIGRTDRGRKRARGAALMSIRGIVFYIKWIAFLFEI